MNPQHGLRVSQTPWWRIGLQYGVLSAICGLCLLVAHLIG